MPLDAQRGRERPERRDMPAAAEPTGGGRPEIGEDGEEVEEPAQDVAPLRDPGDRLHPEGMEAEHERRDRRASRDRSRSGRLVGEAGGEETARDQKDEPGVRGVQEQVAGVVAARIHATEHVVEAEGEPRQRDVVAHPGRGEHPPDLVPSEPPVVRVLHEVPIVVPVEELPAERRKECHDADGGDQDREGDGPGHLAGELCRERRGEAMESGGFALGVDGPAGEPVRAGEPEALLRRARVEGHRALEDGDGLRALAALDEHLAERTQHGRVVAGERARLRPELGRLVPVALADQLHRPRPERAREHAAGPGVILDPPRALP